MRNIQLFNEDNIQVMKRLPDESVDVICIDPPYLYLKGQKLERPFDEHLFFSECQRLLTKKGFIVMFGRGVSFYRWNTILADLGFEFKEEIIWNKSYCTSPLMNISRVHETIAILTKGKGTINKVKVPYLEMKGHYIDSIVTDIKRLKTTFKNTKSLNAVLEFLENNKVPTDGIFERKHKVVANTTKNMDRCASVMAGIQNGLNEKSIITKTEDIAYGKVTCQRVEKPNRCVSVMQSVAYGLNEKSIIKQTRDHYNTIHPTQKPVRLLERLLALVVPKDKKAKDIVVADFFAGSMSCMEAVYNMGMQGIACEIDKEYFEAGKQRIESLQPKLAI